MSPNTLSYHSSTQKANKTIVTVSGDSDYRQFVDDTITSLNDGRIPKLPTAPLDQIFKKNLIPKNGLILDFGIGTGWFTRYIAGELKGRKMFGFDSFKGLPSDWVPKQGAMPETAKGSFAQTKLPEVPDNVELVVGMFDDTLPGFANKHNNETIALLHNDSVMYESTKSIFDNLGHMIVPGTIIVMDELFDYPQYADHELKAFFEFLVRRAKERGEGCCQFEWIGTGDVLLEDCFTDPKYESGIYIDPTGAKLVSQDINLLMRCGIKIISI